MRHRPAEANAIGDDLPAGRQGAGVLPKTRVHSAFTAPG